MKAWIARDKDGGLWMYGQKPYKEKNEDIWLLNGIGCLAIKLEDDTFPNVSFKDKKPTEVDITIKVKGE